MLKEVTRDLDNIEERLNESQENLNREQEQLSEEAIRNMEEHFSLNGVSASDLDSSLWSPYSDWKEKVRDLCGKGSEFDIFLSNMRIDIGRVNCEKNSDKEITLITTLIKVPMATQKKSLIEIEEVRLRTTILEKMGGIAMRTLIQTFLLILKI